MTIDQPHWLRGALDESALQALDDINNCGSRPGNRPRLDQNLVTSLEPVTQQINGLSIGMRPVRVVAFDKSQAANWALPWHQDRVIAVKARHTAAGFSHWSRKHDIWHCEPPKDVLQSMLFVRVHLDDCESDTGPMEIASGSNAAGIVPADRAEATAQSYPSEVCVAQRGDILALPMLTLHRSLAATQPSARRVLRIDYAALPLPPPLAWVN